MIKFVMWIKKLNCDKTQNWTILENSIGDKTQKLISQKLELWQNQETQICTKFNYIFLLQNFKIRFL